MTLVLKSPAKVNLFFRVIGKREDGYHEIASLYQAIDWCDTMTIDKSMSTTLRCNQSDVPTDSSNLILQAHQEFERATGLNFPVEVFLDKKIPLGGGLGGGSSNAATALYAFNELADRPLTEEQLQGCAEVIGADVPFFFSSGSAYCIGKGEKVVNVRKPSIDSMWLAFPSVSCMTPEVFQECRVNESSSLDPGKIVEGFAEDRFQFVNDLEPAALRLYPTLEITRDKLVGLGFRDVFMTGSGSSFVGVNPPVGAIPDDLGLVEAKLISKNKNKWW